MEIRIPLPDRHQAQWLAGPNERNLREVEAELGIDASLRGEGLVVSGDERHVGLAVRLFTQLLPLAEEEDVLDQPRLRSALEALRDDAEAPVGALFNEVIVRTAKGKPVRARTLAQQAYVAAILANTLTFGIGAAGSGKTFLAAALAVRYLKERLISRIILTRPVVEAGESLGFLPGDVQAKVDPYFRPLYDAMYELLEGDRFAKHLERGMIEVAPLAYMRGRTLNDAFIILDEAQNTTPEQMKMFLTRIGFGSHVVVTGDPSQVDLPRGKRSALQDMEPLLGGLTDVAFVRFGHRDVVRHDLVRRIVQAYEVWEGRTPE
jgi:phosphate starvation-inducible PhoH-like protein